MTSGSPDGLCLCCAERVHRHLDGHEVRYLQFAFRWMNNLLMRELPLRCTIRLWDTYQVSTCPWPSTTLPSPTLESLHNALFIATKSL